MKFGVSMQVEKTTSVYFESSESVDIRSGITEVGLAIEAVQETDVEQFLRKLKNLPSAPPKTHYVDPLLRKPYTKK